MTILLPGQKLTKSLSSDAISAMGDELCGMIQDLEREYAPLFRSIKQWWDWYEAKPRYRERNFPFKNASNAVVPSIGIACDALISRSMSLLTAGGSRFWIVKTENEEKLAHAQNLQRHINLQASGHSFHFNLFLSDWLTELYVLGSATAAITYRRDVRPMFYGPVTQSGVPKSQPVELRRGPVIEFLPRETVLWDTRTHIADAPLVVRQHEYTYAQLLQMQQLDDSWSLPAIESIKSHGGNDYDYGAQRIRQSKDESDDREPIGERTTTYFEPHDVREVHIDYPMLGARFDIPSDPSSRVLTPPLIVHIHRRTGTVLRCVASPYFMPYKPFFAGYFRKRAGRGHAVGVAKKLEHIQSMQTTMFNQAIDSQTRANAIWAKTRNKRHLTEPIDPSKPIFVNDPNEFVEMKLSNPLAPNMALLQAAQVMTERWMGTSDPLMGRETRSGGHPAPATSTLALLQQVSTMAAATDTIINQEVSRMGEAMAILDQQFETNEDGRLQIIYGPLDAAVLEETTVLPTDPIPANYVFQVLGYSRTDNPDMQIQRALLVAQANNNYWAFVLKGVQIIETPQVGPRVKTIWVRAIESMTRLFDRFLDANEIDDMERFLAQLNEVSIDTRNTFQQFVGEAQAVAQAAQAAGPGGGPAPGAGAPGQGPGAVQAGGPVGGPGGGPGGGTPGSFAGIGVLQ